MKRNNDLNSSNNNNENDVKKPLLAIYCRTSREQDPETSSIISQREYGIKFAEKNKFEYRLYEDEGISGHKLPKGDDPLSKRPAMADLINDIKEDKIKRVWMWEYSRLGRNQYANAYIFKTFDENDVIFFVKDSQFDYKESQDKLMRKMLDAFAEYETDLIAARMKRGKLKSFELGKKTHPNLYCYQKNGLDDTGHVKWELVESEVNNYKYAIKRYDEGASLRKICFELYKANRIDINKYKVLASWMANVLRKYQYTGYQLLSKGQEILEKYKNFEIDTLSELNDRQYWVKSVPYPHELITIENWIKLYERLQVLRQLMTFKKKERILNADSDIATSLISCSSCGLRYYYFNSKTKNRYGKEYLYHCYKHHSRFNGLVCNQKPKTINQKVVNEIFKTFYFYFYMIFDNTNNLIQETLRRYKQEGIIIDEQIKSQDKKIKKMESKIIRYEKTMDALDENNVNDTIIIVKAINDIKNELSNEINNTISLKTQKEELIEKYNQTEMEMTFYDVTERIINFYDNQKIEEQRAELIHIIQKCLIFGDYILIDTGLIIFLFDINETREFDMTLIDDLKGNGIIGKPDADKDEMVLIEYFKWYFLDFDNFSGEILNKMDNAGKMTFTIAMNRLRIINEVFVQNINLQKDGRMNEANILLDAINIKYDLTNRTNMIVFIDTFKLNNYETKTIFIK